MEGIRGSCFYRFVLGRMRGECLGSGEGELGVEGGRSRCVGRMKYFVWGFSNLGFFGWFLLWGRGIFF